MMINEERLGKLRVAFAAALKYSDCYGQSPNHPEWHTLWRTVLEGGKLPISITLNTIAGDIFAFWFNELRLPGRNYDEVATLFFERLRGTDEAETQTGTMET